MRGGLKAIISSIISIQFFRIIINFNYNSEKMEVNQDNIERIRKAIKYMEEEFKLDSFFDEEDGVKIGDSFITIPFPYDEITCSIGKFLKYEPEIYALRIYEKSIIRGKKVTQIVLDSYNTNLEGLIENTNLEYVTPDSIQFKIISKPILIGLAAVKLDIYDNFAKPCSFYYALEIQYPEDYKLTFEEEKQLIKLYFLEIAQSTGILLSFSEIVESGYYFNEEDEENENQYQRELIDNVSKLSSVDFKCFSPCIDMFLKSLRLPDDDIKILYFYKIIEYISPIYRDYIFCESIVKDSKRYNDEKVRNEHIESILKLSTQYNNMSKDKELINLFFREYVSLETHLDNLPDSIKKKIIKDYKISKFDNELSSIIREKISNFVGSYIFQTRNHIVHAKPNIRSKAYVCGEDEYIQLNKFLQNVCYEAITLFDKIPEKFKNRTLFEEK